MPDELKHLIDLHRDVHQKDGAVSICTHDGQAHADEIAALAILLWIFPEAYVNRTRTGHIIEDHLSSDDKIVVDVGEVYDPERLAFDHHQDPELSSSFVLVAEHFLGQEWAEDAALTYKWWNATDIADCRGLEAAYKATSLAAVANPPVGVLLKWDVSQQSVIEPGSGLHNDLRRRGRVIIEQMHELHQARDAILADAKVETMQIQDGTVDITAGSSDGLRILQTDVPGTPIVYSLVARQCPYEISITRQNNGEWHIWRAGKIEDIIDLTRCQSLPGCTFTHSQGMLAGFKGRRAAIQAIVALGYEASGGMSAEAFIEAVS